MFGKGDEVFAKRGEEVLRKGTEKAIYGDFRVHEKGGRERY